MTTTAARLLVSCLEAEGVPYVFGIPGEETLDLSDALDLSTIRFVPVRHEQAGAFMADVYGRLTGHAGVCLATLGPGATNLLTGVADAYLDRAPLVALTGQAGLERMHKESHQYIDVLSLMKPVTKWNARISEPGIVPEAVRKAFKLAETEKPGSTHLELPEDVMAAEAYGSPLRRTESFRPQPAEADIERAAEVLRSGERPIVLAGNGAVREGASAALRAFMRQTSIPVATTFMGKGLVDPSSDSLALGAVGLQAGDYLLAGFGEADVVMTVGYDLVEHAPRNWNPKADKRIVCIDSLPAEIDDHFIPEVELVGDIGYSLRALAECCGQHHSATPHRDLRQTMDRAMANARSDDAYPMRPARIIAEIREALGRTDLLISDVGLHKLWIGRMYLAQEPNTVLIANGLAGMGFAVPAAIAAKLVHPETRVVAVSGDGGFLMNAQELETAVRLRTPFVNMVWENRQFGSIAWKQERRFGRHFGTDFSNPDFVALASSFGLPAWRVSAAGELPELLGKALQLEVPSLIAVPVEYTPDLSKVDGLGEETAPT
jgi:acetolactate synthase I/II/III large subunit